MEQLERIVAERIRRGGPIRYDDVIEFALYHPEHGFYQAGGQAGGHRGDFITSPEVGPLFGAILAVALDTWWRELGEPDPFVVVEAAAGRGALAVAVLHARPACTAALRYVLVERSAALRAQQGEHLSLEVPGNAFGPIEGGDGAPGADVPPLRGAGPVIVSIPEMPAVRFRGVVLANELLDNLGFRLLEWCDGAWFEVLVGLDDRGRPAETLVAAHPTLAARARELVPEPPPGARIPYQPAAARWVREALALVDRGRLVVVDYADTTSGMAHRPWTDWLRTYRGHARGAHPLEHLGEQDVTCDVAVDQLGATGRPTSDRSQAEFLRAHGIDALVAEGKAQWEAKAHAPDLEALAGRSRVREAEALLDPEGLGAHRVLEWVNR